MTKESHQRASELLPLIEEAKINLTKWEIAHSFKSDASIACHFPGNNGYSWVCPKHLPFDVIKTLSIAGYKKEIEALENEFNSL